MAYGLQQNEALATGLKRVAEEQLDGAIVALQSFKEHAQDGHAEAADFHEVPHRFGGTACALCASKDLNAGIYAARKNLKRSRSVLRLLAPHLGAIYTEENRRLRDVARRFSALRDAHVSLELLAKFADHYKRKGTLNPQRKAITEKQSALQRETNWEAVLAESISALHATRHRIEDWPLHHLTQASLSAGIRKTHKESRHAFRHARKTRLAADFHEFRKSVKCELNQLRLLALPGSQTGDLKKLATLLGDHHNLAVLIANLQNASARFCGLIRAQMRQLERGIVSLASRIYLEALDNGARV